MIRFRATSFRRHLDIGPFTLSWRRRSIRIRCGIGYCFLLERR